MRPDGAIMMLANVHPVPSADGTLIATILSSSLLIHSSNSSKVIQTHNLPQDVSNKCRILRWSNKAQPSTDHYLPSRILVATDDIIQVYDPQDPQWKATIKHPFGPSSRIANADFGFTSNEIVVFSEFGLKATIWSLETGQGVEVRDPKFSEHGRCHDYRPRTGHMALLLRSTAQDSLLIMEPKTHKVIRCVELGTIDAQEVRWSADGLWIAVRDTATSGYKILIYTADGQLFKSWNGRLSDDIDLGAKILQWNTTTNAVAIGDNNDEVVLLGRNKVRLICQRRESC